MGIRSFLTGTLLLTSAFSFAQTEVSLEAFGQDVLSNIDNLTNIKAGMTWVETEKRTIDECEVKYITTETVITRSSSQIQTLVNVEQIVTKGDEKCSGYNTKREYIKVSNSDNSVEDLLKLDLQQVSAYRIISLGESRYNITMEINYNGTTFHADTYINLKKTLMDLAEKLVVDGKEVEVATRIADVKLDKNKLSDLNVEVELEMGYNYFGELLQKKYGEVFGPYFDTTKQTLGL